MELSLKNKVALVTASSKGIGRATAETLMNEGCRVAICSSNKENLDRAASEIAAIYGNEPLSVICDLNKPEDLENTVKAVEETYGNIDILVNNCGGPPAGYFEDLTEEQWNFSFHQVLMSAVRLTKLVLPSMKKNNWGRVINITSLSVKQPVDNLLLSNTFRTGLTAFAKTISNQYGRYGITINTIAPGYTLTARLYELAIDEAKRTGKSHEEVLASMAAKVPMERLGKPEEIAYLVAFLASERAGYITGTTIPVDGGVIKSTF